MNPKFMKKVLVVFVLNACCRVCLAATETDSDSMGIERIASASKYAYFADKSNPYFCYLGYGYKLPIKGNFSHHGGFRYWAVNDRGHDAWAPVPEITSGNLTDDIKGAFLDRDRFDVALAENRFFDAWSMGRDTEQGNLWKRLAISKTRERIGQLVTRSILEDNPAKLAEAHGISSSFPEPILGELSAFIETEITSARAVHSGLAPDVASRTAALRSVADRLFG